MSDRTCRFCLGPIVGRTTKAKTCGQTCDRGWRAYAQGRRRPGLVARSFTRSCDRCGAEFEVRDGRQLKKRYCSQACRLHPERYVPAPPPPPRPCARCGVEYQPKMDRLDWRWCSPQCQEADYRDRPEVRERLRQADRERDARRRGRVRKAKCRLCGKPQPPGRNHRPTCAECLTERRPPKPPPSCPVVFGDCELCGATFVVRWGRRRWCSGACKVAGRYVGQSSPVEYVRCRCARLFASDGRLGKRYCSARCARRYGGRRGSNVSPAKRRQVFERDGWVCHLCGEPIPRRGRHLNRPDDPTVDHIVPRSQGGSDRLDNLAAAHMRCNSERGDMPLDQWRSVMQSRA